MVIAISRVFRLALSFCIVTIAVWAQVANTAIDPRIASFVNSIKAVDNHAHPVLPPPNETTDRDFDALPVDNMEPQTDPAAWRSGNQQLPAAWKVLWGFTGNAPLSANSAKQLDEMRRAKKVQLGEHYAQWVLDRAGIDVMLANRVSMGPGIAPPHFQWVPYEDALLLPLNTSGLAAASPDRKLFFPLEDRVRTRYLAALQRDSVPPTLDSYVEMIVLPTLRRQHAEGAVAAKFEAAYLRSLDFGEASKADARRVYAKYAGHGTPGDAEYRTLQDFLFRVIVAECGRLNMPVHLHAMSGAGSYFEISGGNPLALEPILNDPQLRSTRFVMLHGGWPFVHEAGALLQKPNVYLDFSQQALIIPPHTLAGWLREWLEMFPDKVLFGTDGFPLSSALGWEESTWIASRNARQALGVALTGMLRDGEIDIDHARSMAEAVMRGTAMQLYKRLQL